MSNFMLSPQIDNFNEIMEFNVGLLKKRMFRKSEENSSSSLLLIRDLSCFDSNTMREATIDNKETDDAIEANFTYLIPSKATLLHFH